MSEPRIFFNLTHAEMALLLLPVVGDGGYQKFMRRLLAKMQSGEGLADADLGRLMRHMAYGSGGYQGRLRAAFSRSIKERFGL